MRKLHVDLGLDSYDIIFERVLLSHVADYVACDGKKICVVTDENVAKLYADDVLSSLKKAGYETSVIVLPHGEKTKSFDVLPSVYARLLEEKITRKDALVDLGGVVIGDLCGFVAATYLRGIGFVQIPTSLLAQVDSSIGGKVAVDLPQGKNLVGAFYQPDVVLIDTTALDTLPDYYYSDGMAEVIKYGCIRDAALFDALSACKGGRIAPDKQDEIIYRCCDIKREVVEKDEKDKGERMILNFGHTYGHALEKYYAFEKISHGMAVAVGMCVITRKAEEKGLTKKGCAEKIESVCRLFGLPVSDPAPEREVVAGVVNDKKNLGDKLVTVLLKDIGESYLYPTNAEFFADER